MRDQEVDLSKEMNVDETKQDSSFVRNSAGPRTTARMRPVYNKAGIHALESQ